MKNVVLFQHWALFWNYSKQICSLSLSAEYSMTGILVMVSLLILEVTVFLSDIEFLSFPKLWVNLCQCWCCAVRLPSLHATFWSLASITSLNVIFCLWCGSAKNLELSRSKNANKVVILKQFLLLHLLDVMLIYWIVCFELINVWQVLS